MFGFIGVHDWCAKEVTYLQSKMLLYKEGGTSVLKEGYTELGMGYV